MINHEERRLAKLRVTKEAILDLLKPGKHLYESIDGLPEDVQIKAVFVEYQYPDEISLILSSSKFEPVLLGQIIPEVHPTPTYRRLPNGTNEN